MGLKALFKITADGADITAQIRDRLLSLKVRDEKGWKSDTCEIELDDRENRIELPRTGAKLGIWMGKREELAKMGEFVIDEPGIFGPPDTIRISGKAADMQLGLKQRKTRGFDNVTMGDLVAGIAASHGLTPMCSAALAGKTFTRIDQTNESDMHLLTRLAEECDAVASVKNSRLVFVPRGEAKSASGKELPRINIARHQITRWDAVFPERGKYPQVVGRWHDQASAAEQKVSAGSGEPVHVLPRVYANANAAYTAASAKLQALARGEGSCSLSLLGDNRLAAENIAVISGMRSGLNGEWLINSAEHTLDDGGYVTDLELEIKENK